MTPSRSLPTEITLPSLSLNQADLKSPLVTMPFTVFRPGMSYSSKTTPRRRNSVTVFSTSSTTIEAAVVSPRFIVLL
jgi:hypothetical protein